MRAAKVGRVWLFPRACKNGHTLRSEADVMRHADKWQRCRACHADTVRKQRERAALEHQRPKPDVPAPSPKRRKLLGPMTSIPADADIVRVWAEANGIPFRSWSDLPSVNAARRRARRLEFEARP